jgi:glycosyltransferase involved in cell wall biosynthesis
VATFRRPAGLLNLLEALERLEFAGGGAPSVRVIVVDNDPSSGTAAQVCQNLSDYRWDLKLLAEERRGISFARNTAVQEAVALGADAIVFIDDDETPDPRWLDVLLQVQMDSGAEAVAGPVIPSYEAAVPQWVIQGRFFNRPRFRTGTAVRFAPTCNLLLLTRALQEFGLSFDTRFGLSGGEDTLLTLRLRRFGARIVWANEAVVRECIPSNRGSMNHILKRAFASGTNWARIEREVDPSLWTAFARGVTATSRIVQGCLLLPLSVAIGRHAIVKAAAKICLGVGTLAGLFRVRSRLYQ